MKRGLTSLLTAALLTLTLAGCGWHCRHHQQNQKQCCKCPTNCPQQGQGQPAQ